MKITDVQTFLMEGVRRQWLFVKISTDEGVYGWGEGTLERHEKTVQAAIYAISDRIEGRDPTQIEKLWQALYRHGFWKGGVVLGSAISAIDQALWDITGKVYGQKRSSSSRSILSGLRSMPMPGPLGTRITPLIGSTGLARKNWWIAFHFTKYS